MNKVAIVVLNYLNYRDTIECVDSILKMQYQICGIVVVDNGSYNESYEELKKFYKTNSKVWIIASKKNQGYARGNNLGINYARRKLKAAFVLVVNNDTVFIDKEYIKGLLRNYEPGVGIIGSRIFLRDGNEQYPMVCYLELRDAVKRYINMLSRKYGSSFEFASNQGESTIILHGCALLFTPDFFKWYTGFFDRTFLYGEEGILYLMCRYKGLKQIYVPEVEIYHKEDQSSLMSFGNDESVIEKYALQSEKYVILWIIKYKINCWLLHVLRYKENIRK